MNTKKEDEYGDSMLEFRIVEDGQGVHIDEYIIGANGTHHTQISKGLQNKKFKDEWYLKHHQHKIDELFKNGFNGKLYVSGDDSHRGNGLHYE